MPGPSAIAALENTAAIAPGSSGGPLVNLRGEVIGINSRGMGQTQGFTIPINVAVEVRDELMKTGNIERGWLGMITQPLNRSFAKYLGKPDMEGVIVSDVFDGSPAIKAGIKPGDVLLNYGDEKLSAEKEDDLNKLTLLIAQTSVGSEKTLTIYRGGDTRKITVTVGEQPKVKADEYETSLGFTVKEITDDMFRTMLLETTEGVFVSFVDVGTVADKASLVEGRLDLPGVNIFPGSVVTAPFHPDQAISFRWLVTAGNESPLPGRLWLTLITNDAAGADTRNAVLARPLELDIRQILGMPLPEVRWLGGGMAGLGLVAGALQLRARPKLWKTGHKAGAHSK